MSSGNLSNESYQNNNNQSLNFTKNNFRLALKQQQDEVLHLFDKKDELFDETKDLISELNK